MSSNRTKKLLNPSKMKVFEEISVCPHCNEPAEERFLGDEGWTFCSGECGCIEFEGSETRYVCPDCEQIVDEPKCNCK